MQTVDLIQIMCQLNCLENDNNIFNNHKLSLEVFTIQFEKSKLSAKFNHSFCQAHCQDVRSARMHALVEQLFVKLLHCATL